MNLRPLYNIVACLLISVALPLMTGCASTGTGGSSFITTIQTDAAAATATAEKLLPNTPAYLQTLANAVQTGAGLVEMTAPTVEAIAQQWGAMPAGSSQLASYNSFVNAVANVGSDGAALQKLLTSIQATGIIPSTATTTGSYHYHFPSTGAVAWNPSRY